MLNYWSASSYWFPRKKEALVKDIVVLNGVINIRELFSLKGNNTMSEKLIDREVFVTVVKSIINRRDKTKDVQVGERFFSSHRELELEFKYKDKKIIPVRLTVNVMGESYMVRPNGVVSVVHLDDIFSEDDDVASSDEQDTDDHSVESPLRFFEREINDDVAMVKIIQSYLLWRVDILEENGI